MWQKSTFLSGLILASACLFQPLDAAAPARPKGWMAGAASVDITPDYPVRLSGYGSRTTPHEGVEMRLHAKALALTWQDTLPVVMLTVDNCGVSAAMRAEVLKRLREQGFMLENERFSLHSSHTHCAPALPGVLSFLFGKDLPPEEQAAVERYGEELTVKMVEAVRAALEKQKPARLDWSQGKVSFALNRRLKTDKGYANSPNLTGVRDQALPLLRVKEQGGRLLALYMSYACHCTTLSINKTHPDWAGCAQKELELRFPGVVAMTAIGCGGDQNPYPRRELEHAVRHGVEMAKEAVRLINEPMTPVKGPVACASRQVLLPFDTPHSRAMWEERSRDSNKWTAHHARHFLSLLDKGEAIPASLPYEVQVWAFTKDLLTINLPGEVVVDYGLRFKKQYDPARTWVNAYTNDVPCYIPSQRVWEEGGYEAAGAMVYYGRPNRFASGVEEIIAQAVHGLIPPGFDPPPAQAEK